MLASHNRILVVLVSLIILVAVVMTPDWKRSETFSIAVGVWPGMETLVLARERGLLDSERVKLVEVTWDSAGARALENRAVEAAVLTLDEALRLRESGHDIRVVLVFDQSLSGDAIVARAGIQSIPELRGRRVGVDLRAAEMFLLAAALKQHGMTAGDLNIVPISPPDMPAALSGGDVDAVVCANPWLVPAKSAGGAVTLFEARDVGIPWLRVLVIRHEAGANHREAIEKVARAHFDLIEDLKAGREIAGLEAVLRRERTDRAGLQSMLRAIQLLGREDNQRLLDGGDADLIRVGRDLEVTLRSAGQLKEDMPAGSWVDASYLPKR